MSASQFTPGPWHVRHHRKSYGVNGGPEALNIATVTLSYNREHLHEEKFANANLIAAAPELYEALDELHRSIMGEPVGGGDGQTFTRGTPSAATLNKANAALRKARGDQ